MKKFESKTVLSDSISSIKKALIPSIVNGTIYKKIKRLFFRDNFTY
jgi:hypothetical protein